MPFPIEEKLVVAVASSALFDLKESDNIFKTKGVEEYRKHQTGKINKPFKKGVAFPFIRRLLKYNEIFSEKKPVEVIFLSRNDADTGQRLYRSAEHYGLPITRGAFLSGKAPYPYIKAFNASLFLSAYQEDVRAAVDQGFPGGLVLNGDNIKDDDEDSHQLRIAFDFDGVIADDESEKFFEKEKSLSKYHKNELEHKNEPLKPGPLKDLLDKINSIQKLEWEKKKSDDWYIPGLSIAIVTARNAPADERFVTTMKDFGVSVDETFFLGGIEKKRILDVLKPHIFFDDQVAHLKSTSSTIPSVHIPFGVKNWNNKIVEGDKEKNKEISEDK